MKKSFKLIFQICSWACLIFAFICLIIFFFNLFFGDYLSAIYYFIFFVLFIIVGWLHDKEANKINL